MKRIDVLLDFLIPSLILLHLRVAPYTKVEESFNIQAIHDIATYGLPTSNISAYLQKYYDHFSFPGAVPRTFFGALSIAPGVNAITRLLGREHGQFLARLLLGLWNALALRVFKSGVDRAFGKDVGRWYVLLQATQFHVIFYASRTLPNMFAFGLTTLAFRAFLDDIHVGDGHADKRRKLRAALELKQKWGIFLFVFAGVVFRSEIAILLFAQLLNLLLRNRILSVRKLVRDGIQAVIFSLALSVPVDSYFWWKPIWPELAGFYYNAIQGKSADWGTSPVGYYWTTLLPKLLHNPLIRNVLVPMALMIPATRYHAWGLTFPAVLFVGIYSLQPHKESRFIIYVVPPLTATAALFASYIWTRRTKSLLYRLSSLVLLASVLLSFVTSTGMLLISSLNYPGGQALSQFHNIIKQATWPTKTTAPYETIAVHMDVLSCMTGVTRFLELHPRNPPVSSLPLISNRRVQLIYDKTEDEEALLTPQFWEKFDYALMEEPEKAIGKWEILDTVFAYDGIEMLRPGDGSGSSERLERVYEANNLSRVVGGEEMPPRSADVINTLEEKEAEGKAGTRVTLMFDEIIRFGTFNLVREAVRDVTGGWWVGPRMVPKIKILRRVKGLPLE